MTPRTLLAGLAGATLLAGAAAGQIQTASPNYDLTTLAVGLSVTGQSMEVDRHGNVYILDQPTTPGAFGGTVTMVASTGGQANPYGPFGHVGQLAYNPTDGFVYLVSYAPLLPVIHSDVWRLDPNGGSTQVFGVDVVADGFTIDDEGRYYFGGMGLQGPGLYAVKPPVLGLGAQAQFVSPGFGANARLQSLVSGAVLIADGDMVERWIPGGVATVPFYDAPGPFPNNPTFVNGLARGPMNAVGVVAMIGQNSFGTFCFCGTGSAIATGLTGALVGPAAAPFAKEDYGFPNNGLVTLASGIRQDLYWLSDVNTTPLPVAGKVLTRISQQPAPNEQGSLFVAATATSVTFDAYGPVAGGDPFLLGVMLDSFAANGGVFLPPWGHVDLYPYASGYVPLLDGVGAFGPPNPFAVFPPGGQFVIQFPVPPGFSGLVFESQVLTLSTQAPNGFFFVSNTAEFLIL